MSMAGKGILFVVLPERRSVEVRAAVDTMIVPNERKSVIVLTDAFQNSVDNARGKVSERLIDTIENYSAHPENRLLIDRETVCSIDRLSDWWEISEHGKESAQKLAPRGIERSIKAHLKATGLHWRSHATAEISKFDGATSTLDAWLQQFSELGHSQIARKIASQLRVVRTGIFSSSAFRERKADTLGCRRANCYVRDDDEGGSWVEMQNVLTHAFSPSTVFPIYWDESVGDISYPDIFVDEIVIYEDGLWSGHEMVRRLKAIAATPPTASIVFRFGVVTDFGLMVARQAIRYLNLSGKVTIDASASEVVEFLQQVDEEMRYGLNLDLPSYYKALHSFVRPLAFGTNNEWNQDEIKVCEEIGEQLVHRWLLEKDGKAPTKESVQRYALGGGGFASTIVFSRSVPKVCLPLLWLNGAVSLGGREVNWKPLFIDSRRVSDENLLNSH